MTHTNTAASNGRAAPSSFVNKVGVIGAGRMGLPIIRHLAAQEFDVIVHDIDTEKRKAVEEVGAYWQAELNMLAEGCDALLVCVGYDEQLRQLASPDGMLSRMRPGALLALLSTVKPDTVRWLAQQGRDLGIVVFDAPVCRGGRAADTGTLLTFVGGDEKALEVLRPVLQAYSTDIVHTGDAGSAQIAKAANNMVLWACLVANHEAFALAHHHGLDIDKLRLALLMSSASNDVLKHWGTNEMVWAEDDLAIVAELARDGGMTLPQTETVREVCRVLRPKRYQLDAYGR